MADLPSAGLYDGELGLTADYTLRSGYAVKSLDLDEAAAFLHMHPEEVRSRTKRGLIPGAKAGRRWVFLEIDLADFLRSLYPCLLYTSRCV